MTRQHWLDLGQFRWLKMGYQSCPESFRWNELVDAVDDWCMSFMCCAVLLSVALLILPITINNLTLKLDMVLIHWWVFFESWYSGAWRFTYGRLQRRLSWLVWAPTRREHQLDGSGGQCCQREVSWSGSRPSTHKCCICKVCRSERWEPVLCKQRGEGNWHSSQDITQPYWANMKGVGDLIFEV